MSTIVLIGGGVATVGISFILNTLFATTSTIYSTLHYLLTSDENYFIDLKEIQFSTQVLYEFVKECKADRNSVKLSLIGVNEVLEKIETELSMIANDYDNHKNKYFAKFRRFKYDKSKLKNYKTTLDSRVELLINILIKI